MPRFVVEAQRAAVRNGLAEPVIEVIPTASGNPAGSLAHNRGLLASIATVGMVQGIELGVDNADLATTPEVAARLAQASGVWFTGGNQSRIVSVFRPTESDVPTLHSVLSQSLAAGGVIGGSSAGAAIMSETMLAGGTSEGALLHGEGEGGLKLASGLGFFPHGIVDQHFLARGRLGRLLVALELTGERYGFGIEENSALVVYLGDHAVGLGSRGVCILDRGRFSENADSGTRNFELTLLGTGDRWDFETGKASPRAGRIDSVVNKPSSVVSTSDPSSTELWESGAIDEALLLLSRDPSRPQVLLSEGFRRELDCGRNTMLRVAPDNARDLFAAQVVCRLTERRE